MVAMTSARGFPARAGSSSCTELHGELPLSQAHDLCVAVENAIHDRYPNAEVLVHADPLEVAPPRR